MQALTEQEIRLAEVALLCGKRELTERDIARLRALKEVVGEAQ